MSCDFMLKNLFSFIVVFGILFASSGLTTLEWPDSAHFKFSTAQTFSYDDYLASGTNQDPTDMYDIVLEPWDQPAWCANRIDMGNVPLSSLTIPPTSGYSDDVLGFADCDYVNEGHAYWIKTRTGAYAKVKVTEAVHLGSTDADGNINRITFEWNYLTDGTSDNLICCPASVVLPGLILAGFLLSRK